ncbi:hypothetical protein SAMN02745148_01937 [Modicisalibacter ilicicola DSM 19980]|uniref:Spore coat protein U (SCPU) domain-containing protein n=1 Tax=Modicisalibacter ilicicola DSM 19980 TaxID=1121942 RepID=A0A1M4ZB86_9GAMM|nr:spore coat protein U domain-containing protein [Halomonas ilicicola]SHF15274.1 hypothetical protein SAMN02745148_01937 [Halomonas ilicicola DSM 19980]
MKRLHRFVLMAMLIVLQGVAQGDPVSSAACEARIESITLKGAMDYSPFDRWDRVETLDIHVRRGGVCTLAFTFESHNRNRLSGSRESLTYRIQTHSGNDLRLNGVNVYSGRAIASGDDSRFPVSVVIPAGQPARAGAYSDRVSVQLMNGSRVIDTHELTLKSDVRPQARIRISGSSTTGFSSADGAGLDFGSLTSGEEKSAYLFVQSNSAYALQLTSENRGRLRHVHGSASNAYIAYRAWLDDKLLDLRRAETYRPSPGRALDATTPYRLRVRIGDVSRAIAGRYRDTISVDVLLLE